MSKRDMTSKARKFVLEKMYIVNTILIICHLGFALLYNRFNMDVLTLTNLGCTIMCVIAFIFLKKRILKQYVHFAMYELYAFMIASIIFLGWECGFQHYCISFTIAIFFCDFYLNKNQSISRHSVAMGIFNGILYLGLRIWTYFFPHVYDIGNKVVEKGIFIVNSVLTFSFVLMYMLIYSTTVNKLENELRHIAERDPLTGLYNRRKMMQILDSAFDSENRNNLAVIMFDADYFKKVNDTYGHDAGDEVLKTLADILVGHIDKDRFSVCRWGGEEFLAMYVYDGSKENVIDMLESLRATIENTDILYKETKIRITVTIGLAFYQSGSSLETTIKEVDTLLYNGKEAGRNRVSYKI